VGRGDYISLGEVRVVAKTDRAVLVAGDGTGGADVWFPLSQVAGRSDINDSSDIDDEGELVVSEWIYEQKADELSQRKSASRVLGRLTSRNDTPRRSTERARPFADNPAEPRPVQSGRRVEAGSTGSHGRTLIDLLGSRAKGTGGVAAGLNRALRRALPGFNDPVQSVTPPGIVGQRRAAPRSIAALLGQSPEDRQLARDLKASIAHAKRRSLDEVLGKSEEGASPYRAGTGPQRTREFERIRDLTRRTVDFTQVKDLTPEYAIPGGTWKLRPAQSLALAEMQMLNGLFGVLDLGIGKTLLDLLAPLALDSRKAVLFVPASLKVQLFAVEIPIYRKHFRLPPVFDALSYAAKCSTFERGLYVLSYDDLSRAETGGLLAEIEPDLIVGDEIHRIARPGSARWRRVRGANGYLTEHPETRLCAWSGSVTKHSMLEYAWLLETILGKDAPVPNRHYELESWALAVDVVPEDEKPGPPGVLSQFCKPGESVRSGYGRRLAETPGVVVASVTAEDIGSGLTVTERRPAMPQEVLDVYKHVESTWSFGADEIIPDAMAMSRILRQVASGYYLTWVWPNGKPDVEWQDARKAWHKDVRELLRRRSQPKLDSEKFAREAAERGEKTNLPVGAVKQIDGRWCWRSEAFPAWARVRDRPVPPTKAVWISDFLVRDALAWCDSGAEGAGKDERGGIIWVDSPTFGQKVSELSRGRVPYIGAGESELLVMAMAEKDASKRCVALSRRTHGTGTNLQYTWSRMYFPQPPPNGEAFHQAIGRCHRFGQKADEVAVEWAAHAEINLDAFGKACAQTRYTRETRVGEWKLHVATLVGSAAARWKEILGVGSPGNGAGGGAAVNAEEESQDGSDNE